MSWLASFVLTLIHAVYSLFIHLRSARTNSRHARIPLPITAKRSKLPKHLGLILAYQDDHDEHEELEDVLIQCCKSVVRWAQEAGIEHLTVYDCDGASSIFPNCMVVCSDLLELHRYIGVLIGHRQRVSPQFWMLWRTFGTLAV